MNLRIYTSKEDSINFSRSFSTKLYPKFERSTFLFVDFSINESHKDVLQIQVFYSENGFFYTKFNSENLIRHAFGKWDQLNFMLARDKNKPLHPLFIFDFPLDNSKSPYDATFANVNGELHILSKIYNLSDEHFKILKKSYKLYRIKGVDYTLFDFGNCFSFMDKFLNNIEVILNGVEFILNDSDELIINPIPLDSIRKREDDYKFCMVCGKKLDSTINNNLLEFSRRFPARCEDCLKQIYALDLYNKLNEGSISTNMLSISEMRYLWDIKGLFEYNFKILKDYGFLKPFSDDIYKLYLNDDINETFNSLLNPIEEEQEEESKSKSALDDYFGFTDDKEKPKCRICGEEIEEDDGTDICSSCFDKQMSIEKIHKLIEFVKPGSGFSKSTLIDKGINHIDLDIIISDLEEQGLLKYDSDDLIILANKPKLNEFIKEYSDSDEYLLESTDEGLISTLVIYQDDLKDEKSLDKAINFIDYQEYIEFSSNSRIDGWYLTLKKEGKEVSHKLFYKPFKAKLAAVKYLGEIGIIKIADFDKDIDFDYEPKPKKKSKDKNKYAPPEEGRGQKYNRRCPVCGREFVSYKKKKGTLCSSCVSKYGFFEKKALDGIIKGTYDKGLLSNILLFREEGNSNLEISKKLNLEHDFLIKPLIKFLSDDDLLNRISDNLSEKEIIETEEASVKDTEVLFEESKEEISTDSNESKGDLSQEEIIPEETEKKKNRTCPICKNTFVPRANQKYCNDCKSKFSPLELGVLYDIEQGKYAEETAIEIAKLKQEGRSNQQISNILKLSHPNVITPILNFLLKDANLSERKDESLENTDLSEHKEEDSNIKLKICPICNEEFTPKSRNGLDLCCSDCRNKYTHTEITLLVGVKKGLYTEELADKFLKLKNSGFSNKYVSEKYDIPATLINPIIHYFKDNANEVEGISFHENLSKWLVNVKDNGKTIHLGFYDTKDEAVLARDKYYNPDNQSNKGDEDKLVKQLFYKECGNNYSKIILKGIISDKDRVSIFNFISFINCNLNKLLCEKQKDGNYNLLLDIDIENRRLNSALKDLKRLGWENAK